LTALFRPNDAAPPAKLSCGVQPLGVLGVHAIDLRERAPMLGRVVASEVLKLAPFGLFLRGTLLLGETELRQRLEALALAAADGRDSVNPELLPAVILPAPQLLTLGRNGDGFASA
jgi:hypothetical protein